MDFQVGAAEEVLGEARVQVPGQVQEARIVLGGRAEQVWKEENAKDQMVLRTWAEFQILD